jgi:hypothetical protein
MIEQFIGFVGFKTGKTSERGEKGGKSKISSMFNVQCSNLRVSQGLPWKRTGW